VFDSIADAESVAHINAHLRLWLNHQANHSADGVLNLQTIPAQVRLQLPTAFTPYIMHL
jgi:hypothetical protein